MSGQSWEIPLPCLTPPLSLNQRIHWRKEASIKATLRDVGITYARKLHIPPMDRFTAQLHYLPRQERERDSENLTPCAKPIVDGYCWVHKIPDSHAHYTQLPPVIHPASGRAGRLWVVLTEVPSP